MFPPVARDFDLPARAGDATEETLGVEEDEEEEHPTVFLGALAPIAAKLYDLERRFWQVLYF